MEKISYTIVLSILFFGIGCQKELANKSNTSLLTDADSKAITEAENIGRQIYEYDQYASKATDIMMENVTDPRSIGILGWITTRSEGKCVLLFVAEEQTYISPCRVIFDGLEKPKFIRESRPLTEVETAMFRARQLWPDIIEQKCTENYNTVLLPNEDSSWSLYVLAATADLNSVVVGGHYKAVISADGRTVLNKRGFTKTCMTFPTDKPGLEAYVMTHLLDNTPTEIHVFLSLLSQKDFFIATMDGRHWMVRGDKIKLMVK
jgi:hypothetical protein